MLGKKYKILNIFIVVFMISIFLWNTGLGVDAELENYKQELNGKENWLVSQLNDIASFIDFESNEYDYTNRDIWFYSWYYGFEFDPDRLLALYYNLQKKGWVDITDSIDKYDYSSRTIGNSVNTLNNIRILCNNKATILLYMTDMKNDRAYIDTEVRTLVELLYDYTSPCYDLEEN